MVYDLPHVKRHANVPLDIFMRIKLWSLSASIVEQSAKAEGIDLRNLEYSIIQNANTMYDLRTRRSFGDFERVFSPMQKAYDHSRMQDFWFHCCLLDFRDAFYLYDFVDYCRGTKYASSLVVQPWGTGVDCGKGSVLVNATNIALSELVEFVVAAHRALGS